MTQFSRQVAAALPVPSSPTLGVLAMLGACTIWGLSPLYYKLLAHVPPLEVLSHRTLWSLVFFAGVLLVQGRLAQIGHLLARPKRAGIVLLAALSISTNWFFFIFSVQTGHAMQASLGYYIFPLVAVMIGVVLFGERLSLLKSLAVGLATLAVLWLSRGLGAVPWISLILAMTFGMYGALKRGIAAGPVVSVTAEVLLLSPIALAWLFFAVGADGVYGTNWHDTLLLMVSGPLTGMPLILFSAASRRVEMATVGLLQYLNPTLQFLCATLVFAEPFTPAHAITFALIWTALALYSAEALRQGRAARRASSSASVPGTEVT